MGTYWDSATIFAFDNSGFDAFDLGTDALDGVPADSWIDATPEILALYSSFKQGMIEKRAKELSRAKMARGIKTGIVRPDNLGWFVALDDKRADEVVKLLTSALRSPFRISLRKQLAEWLDAPMGSRRYETPFSAKQWAILTTPFIPARR